MKAFRRDSILVWFVASFLANAGEPLAAKAKVAATQPGDGGLRLLQGTWEGVMVGDKAREKITVSVAGDSFRFHRDTNFWFQTTIALPAGKDPRQLRATITGCPKSQADSIGKVVAAIFKVEDGTLTLIAGGGDADGLPKSLEASENQGLSRYELRKVRLQRPNTQPADVK